MILSLCAVVLPRRSADNFRRRLKSVWHTGNKPEGMADRWTKHFELQMLQQGYTSPWKKRITLILPQASSARRRATEHERAHGVDQHQAFQQAAVLRKHAVGAAGGSVSHTAAEVSR